MHGVTDKSDSHSPTRLITEGFAVFADRDSAAPIIKALGPESSAARLIPKAPAPSRGWSHSDHFGFGQFPWHTDGAIASEPPRWIVLECERLGSATYTELLAPAPDLIKLMRRSVATVTTRSGYRKALPVAVPLPGGRVRLRWDPRVCMTSDGKLAQSISGQPPSTVCEWDPGRVLIFDNWRLLHRRPAVTDPDRVLIRTYIGA